MDHCPLMYFFTQPSLSHHQLYWAENFVDFLPWCSIQYTQGSTNILLDLISQYPDFLASLTMDAAMSNFLDQIQLKQEHDSQLGSFWHHALGQHAVHKVLTNDFGDFLTYKGKLYIPQSFTKTMLQKYHNICGHFGQTYT